MGRIRSLWLFLGLVLLAVSFTDVTADVIPSENECRPYIEKAIHELKNVEPTATDNESIEDDNKTGEDASIETTTTTSEAIEENSNDKESVESAAADDVNSQEQEQPSAEEQQSTEQAEDENKSVEEAQEEGNDENSKEQNETAEDGSKEELNTVEEPEAAEVQEESNETVTEENKDSQDAENDTAEEAATENDSKPEEAEGQESLEESENTGAEQDEDSKEAENDSENQESVEVTQTAEVDSSKEEEQPQTEEDNNSKEEATDDNQDSAEEKVRSKRSISEDAAPEDDTKEDTAEESDNNTAEEADNTAEEVDAKSAEETDNKTAEETDNSTAEETDNKTAEETGEVTDNSQETETAEADSKQEESQEQEATEGEESAEAATEEDAKSEEQEPIEEDLTLGFEIPKNLRNRDHISDLLGLDAESSIKENAIKRTGDVILKELKRIYDNAIKPLETMYKYRDLSNRHFGDPEIFSKPLIVFMGPYSGGKSTILNYLTDNEYTPNSIRSGAEPSPAYFNILMHGDEPEVLDGTQLAADWTFSGLQKFGQGLNDRLRGQKLPSKILERVNIVEIPGILEVRKQVSRYFPFNDACQWFIDRADIIFLVYDPAKLDVGPETEAILDQLKGREYQTRILLNKGDSVKPEELLRVQSALIWNISPLMSSAQPPVMYTVSLWSHPYESGSPNRLLHAQERAMLADLREAIDKRIENKIASARRFAVRIRNHAKMVDCYLTTYYNQKSLFSNKKQVSDKIIEHPQNYNIYEGLSTLTNISRYDLPDPEVYLDFFRLNPLYEFKKLSETCTYFKGCPINKLDIAIAYDLPELVGKYKKLLEENYLQLRKEFDENCNQSSVDPPVKLNSR